MKKRIALLVSFLLIISFFSTVARAAETHPVGNGQTLDLSSGELTVTSTGDYIDTYVFSDGDIISVEAGAAAKLTGTCSFRVTVECGAGVTLTLEDAEIDASGKEGTCALSFAGESNTLNLVEENTLQSGGAAPGIKVEFGTSLSIMGTGSLNAGGGDYGAGIGGGDYDQSGYIGDCGNITILDGTITATGGYAAAGIGNGKYGHSEYFGESGNITISGGIVTANGGQCAAGIGGSGSSKNGTILILGGTVIANGGQSGAGIGSGFLSDSDNITISGGNITSTGGGYAAGIGSGSGGNSGNITISGGTVTALGQTGGAGIGSGQLGDSENITISGGNITSTGGGDAPGIGCSYASVSGNITISNGVVRALGGSRSPGIGGGFNSNGGTITIEGGVVFAEHGAECINDIGVGGDGVEGSLTFSGDSMVYLRYDTCMAITTSAHYHYPYTEKDGNGYLYDKELPTDWTGAGAYIARFPLYYDANGGEGGYTIFKHANTTVTVNDDTGFSKDGFSLKEWNRASDGGGLGYTPGEVLLLGTESVTLYAIWEPVKVTSVDILSGNQYLEPGQTATLSAHITPDDSYDTTIAWESSDTGVATVDANGKVTAKANGSAIVTASCDGQSDTCEITVSTQVILVNITDDTISISEGGTYTLTAELLPSESSTATVYWSTGDGGIAAVDGNGLVTATGAGTCAITATAGGKSDTCEVTVAEVGVTSVSLDINSKSLYVGDWFTLTATVLPSDASNPTVSWQSTDTLVATVTANGVVEAIGAGSCSITATADGKSDACTVSVGTKSVTSISLDESSKSLYIGDWFSLTATVLPSDASNPTVTWLSSDTSVATVTASGVVEVVGDGACTITATADGKSAGCNISVGTKAVTDVTLDYSSQSLNVGDMFALTATVKPDDAADPEVEWSSSDKSVVSVNKRGVITAQDVGACTITAEAGGVTDTCEITVSRESVEVESVSLSMGGDAVIVMYVGDTMVLSANVSPSNADDTSVTWQSSNSAVAGVTGYGKVTAVAEGEAVITVMASDKTDSYRVSVKAIEDAGSGENEQSPGTGETTPTPAAPTPTAVPTLAVEVVYTVHVDTTSLPYGAQYIELPNGEVVKLNGEETITCEICEHDLKDGALKIVALDSEQKALGSIDVEAKESGLSVIMIMLIVLGALILGAGGTLLVIRIIVTKKS